MSDRSAVPAVHRSAEELSRLGFLARKVRRHLTWARTEGIGRLVEEDELDPVDRLRQWHTKAQWRRRHGNSGPARPVLLVGLQRSGTNMMVRGLDRAPEVEVRNENDRRAFHRYRLVPDQRVEQLVAASPHRYVLLKPLCDSHRVDELLDRWGGRLGARAIWAFRDVDGRVRSAVSKFGDDDRVNLAAVAAGRAGDAWQAQRLGEQALDTIRALDPERLSAESASALFWWARNSLVFDLGLDARDDLVVASYAAFVDDPEREMRRICGFLGMAYRPELVAHVDDRSRRRPARLDIDARVRALCDALEERLVRAASAAPVPAAAAGAA